MIEAMPARRSRHFRPYRLWLLCLLYRSKGGKTRSLPIQTQHRQAPFKGPSGCYAKVQNNPVSVAVDLRGLPDGPGIYLRHVDTRLPRAEVLARYQ